MIDLHVLSNVLFETVLPRLLGLDYAPCPIFLVSLSHFLFINLQERYIILDLQRIHCIMLIQLVVFNAFDCFRGREVHYLVAWC